MWKDWNTTERISALALLATLVIGTVATVVPFLAVPDGTTTRADVLLTDFLAAIRTPISVPAWILALAAIAVCWAVARARHRKSSKLDVVRTIVAPVEAAPKPTVFTDRQQDLVRSFRKRGNPWASVNDVAAWLSVDGVQAQYLLNKLHAGGMLYYGADRYQLSDRGIAYAIEQLDGKT